MSDNPTVQKMLEDAQQPSPEGDATDLEVDAGRGYIGFIRHWLGAHALTYHVASNSYYWGGTNFSLKELAQHVRLHLKIGEKRLDKDLLYSALQEVATSERKSLVNGLRQQLCQAPRTSDATLRSWLRELLVADIDKEEFENCVTVLKHWLWLVQRALLGLRQEWHIMPIFWGHGGSGKSHNVKLLLASLGSFWDEASFSVFDSGRFNSMPLHWSFALFLDEMEDVEKTDSAALKRTISSDYLLGRGMFSEDGRHRRRNASFIAVTNDPPPHGLRDASSARRFYSFPCSDVPCLPGTERKKFFDSTDYLAIWRCVDPQAAAPIEARKNRIKMRQHEINRARSLLEEFLDERCERTKDDTDELHFRILTQGLKEYSEDRNIKNYVLPPYRHLRPQLEALDVGCVLKGNVFFAKGLRFRNEIPEDD